MKLTIRKTYLDDWYVIERAAHDGKEWFEPIPGGFSLQCSSRFSDADVEGTSAEMLAIAKAIRERRPESFKRCAVRPCGEGMMAFCSPRNSQEDGVVTIADADDLADEIEKTLAAAKTTAGSENMSETRR